MRLFDDHEGESGPICRLTAGEDGIMGGTLFNIVMNLTERKAVVRLGQPCMPEATVELELDFSRKPDGWNVNVSL